MNRLSPPATSTPSLLWQPVEAEFVDQDSTQKTMVPRRVAPPSADLSLSPPCRGTDSILLLSESRIKCYK